MAFQGFPKETITFFKELAENNNKAWFQSHKTRYEQFVMEPARAFIYEMGQRLEKDIPDIVADPRVNKSLFRINRDTRFSKDKTPYKTNVAVWLWEGSGARMENSGFYLHLTANFLLLGVGIYQFSKPLLDEYRESVIHPEHGPALVRAITSLPQDRGYRVGGKHYKRTPRGYDPDHQNAELLLYNGLTVGAETDIPAALHSSAFLDVCYESYCDFLPVHRWLAAMVKRAGK